jgi:hypothetical protein
MTQHRHLFYSCGLILLLFLFSVPLVQAQQTGTVITKSGDKYENVIIKVNRIYKIIAVESDSLKKNISFDEIDKIIDADGKDVTIKMIEGHAPQAKETWKSEGDSELKKLHERFWKVGIHLGPNYSVSMGDYYEGITTGMGYEGTIHFTVSDEIGIRASISKAGLKTDQGWGLISLNPDLEIISQEYAMTATRYLAGVQYYRRPQAMLPGKAIFYMYTDLGIISHKVTGKISYRLYDVDYYEEPSDSQSKFMTNLGGGVVVLISKKIGIDFGAEFDIVYAGTNSSGSINYAGIFDFKIGLIALL